MNNYRPDGCKMYVANKDLEFYTDVPGQMLNIKKGDVWMLKQLNFGNRVWLNKSLEDEEYLQITVDQLEKDFIEVDIKQIKMEKYYHFDENGACAEKVMLNDYDISKRTFQWSFEDFCEFHNYPLGEYCK